MLSLTLFLSSRIIPLSSQEVMYHWDVFEWNVMIPFYHEPDDQQSLKSLIFQNLLPLPKWQLKDYVLLQKL